MRSHPSCWNKTLAQLGFRRKRRKAKKKINLFRRRSTIESLEQRQMLSATSWSDQQPVSNSVETIVVSPSTIDTQIKTDPQFVIVGGDSKDLFSVTTQIDDAQNPIAALTLKDSAKSSGELQHEIVLELRQGLFGVSRHHVTVTLAGDDFLAAYRQDRLANAEQQLSDVQEESASEHLSNLTESGEFSDLARSGTKQDDLAVVVEVDRLGAIAEALASEKLSFNSSNEKMRFFSGLESAGNKLREISNRDQPTNRGPVINIVSAISIR